MKHNISSLLQLLNSQVTKSIYTELSKSGTAVEVEGFLSGIEDKGYNYFYGIRLYENQQYILLDIPKDVAQKARISGNEYVTVNGVIKPKLDNFTDNRVEFRIEVSRIESTDSPEEVMAANEREASLSKIRALNNTRKPFPYKDKVNLTIISGKSSQVEADFNSEIKKISNFINVTKIAVNMMSAPELIGAIKSADCDILVMIRGGGDFEQFSVFNQMPVIEALSSHRAYRVLGLGHTENDTLLELVADYSANTPAQAGVHIREHITGYQDKLAAVSSALTSTIKLRNKQLAGIGLVVIFLLYYIFK